MQHYLLKMTRLESKVGVTAYPRNTVSPLTRGARRSSTSFIDIELVALKGSSNRGLRHHIVRPRRRARLIIISSREHTAYPATPETRGVHQVRTKCVSVYVRSLTSKVCASHVHPTFVSFRLTYYYLLYLSLCFRTEHFSRITLHHV